MVFFFTSGRFNLNVWQSIPISLTHQLNSAESVSAKDSPAKTIPYSSFRSSSWISWPLSFLFQGVTEDSAAGNVPLRFRHLDTTVRLHPNANKGCNGRQSPSPERDSTKSPKRTPLLARRNNASPVQDD